VAIDREKVLAAAQKYVEKKRYDRAVIEYQRVIQEDPNDARTLLKIGDLQSKMEAYADAVATYERVGKFYASQGFALKAIAVYKQIREIVTRYVPQLEERYGHIAPKLAELYQQLGLTSDALAALDEVATRLQRQNRDAEAIEVFRKIVGLDPTNPLPHLRLAEALSRAKDAERAVAEFATAAGQLAKLGRRDDALKVLERLLHHKPDIAYARLAAEMYLTRNQPNDGLQALAKLQVCFQANPRDIETLGLLARAFNQIGQAAKGVEVQKEMARIARDSGKTELFRELITKLQKIAPNDEVVRALALGSSLPPPASAGEQAVAGGRVSVARHDGAAPKASAAGTPNEPSYEDVGDVDFETEEPIDLARRHPPPSAADDVVVENGIEVIEEVGDAPLSAHTAEQVAHFLEDAAAFRRARLYAKAVQTLHIALEMAPNAVDVYVALRDVLLEAGQTGDAIEVMLALAGLQMEAFDNEGAARSVQDVLAIDPQNTRAAQMLHTLGYELVEVPDSTQTEVAGPPDLLAAADVGPLMPDRQNVSSYDPEAPLPSYDLEEIGPEDVALRRAGARRPSIVDMDDPFADGPLPSFPLDPAEREAAFELVSPTRLEALGTSAPERANADVGRSPKGAAAHADVPAPAPTGPAPELESALEEADFFVARGLYDDARTILNEQVARLPNHPLLLERLAELDAQERGTVGGSGTRPSPAAAAAGGDDASFDIAESLTALDAGDRPSGLETRTSLSETDGQVDVEEVFAKFKEGVAKQIGVDDAQSHYDIGVAYREMALVDDAIREFEMAARDPKLACVSQSMIGTIQLERGNLNGAIDAFMRGLQAVERTRDQEAALSYEIGAAYEVKRMVKPALEYFQRAARLIPAYRDVQERLRRLQRLDAKPPVRAVAVGADDEFDRAFDDILSSGKLP
jgi:tetratricopeptide (TPR) repeat protein